MTKLGKGFPRNFLQEEWQHLLFILQQFVTGEGRYNLTFQYHVRLLLHFESGMTLNFPYFLYKSLVKMSRQVKKKTQNHLSSLHHSGLIKMVVCNALEKQNDTWVSFLNRNKFGSSKQNVEVTSPENDKEERLSNEDNYPLCDRLKEIIQNKLIQT